MANPGARTADLRDFGPTADDVGPALRRAMAALPATGPARLWMPTGHWVAREPLIVERKGTELCGESPSATVLAFSDHGPGLFLYKSAALKPARRPDGFGRLDRVYCPAPGERYGLTLDAVSWHLIPAVAPTYGRGDGWSELPGLALSICFDAEPADGTILGLGDRQEPMPIHLDVYYEPGVGRRVYRLSFATVDRPRAPREFLCGVVGPPGEPGPKRLDFWMGFDRAGEAGLCEILCWQGGRAVPVLRRWGTRLAKATRDEPSFTPGDAIRFARNTLATFKLAAGSFSDHTTQGLGGAFTVFGLSLACDRAFATDGSGRQTRADGGPVDDAYRYAHAGRPAEDLIARMSPAKSDGDDSPVVRWNSGSTTGSVAGFGYCVGDGAVPIEAITLRDFTVQMPDHGGSAILYGPVLGLDLDRVSAGGGAHGLASLNCGASYDVRLRGCAMGGTQAWIKATDTGLDCDGLARGYVPGSAVVLSGCNARLGPIRTGDVTGGRPVVDLAGYNGWDNQYELEHLSIDQEVGSCLVGVRCEKNVAGTRLLLGTIGAGWRDGTTPVVDLIDRAPQGPMGNAPGRCVVRGLIVGAPDVRAEGDWTVTWGK